MEQKIKLSFYQNPEYFQTYNKKNGNQVITCKLVGTITTPYIYVDDDTDKGVLFGLVRPVYNSSDNCIVAIGKAECVWGDKFSVSKGKKIARAKAETLAYRKAAKKMLHRIAKFDKQYDRFVQKMADFLKKTDNINEHNKKYIDRISNEK